MTIECALRFQDSREAPDRALRVVLTEAEAKTAQFLSGGFWFKTERSPMTILADFQEAGFEFEDFESIEFRNI